MSVPLQSIPSFTAAEALDLAKKEYGIGAAISPLPSERDQNFLIGDSAGKRFVLKIANLHDSPQLLDFQNEAMRRVRTTVAECRVPRLETTLQGLEITRIHNHRSGADHCVRLLGWVDGEVLAKCESRGPALFDSIGANMARIDSALSGYSHPAMHRVLQWDLRRAGMARKNAGLLAPGRRSRVEGLFSLWEKIDWTALRHGVIHGDANDYNIIVDGGRMVGLLDFGDMVHSATVCDLAIALAYAMLGEQQPLSVAPRLIRAYQQVHALSVAEQRALYPLVLSRLAMSVCYAAHNRARNPDDPYQVVTEVAAWDLLDRLEQVPVADVVESFGAACMAPGNQ